MGNALSRAPAGKTNTTISESETMSDMGSLSDNEPHSSNEFHDADDGLEESRARAKEDALTEFKNELNIKREQRKAILAKHRAEKVELETSLAQERKTNLDLCETNRLLRELLIENNISIPEELNSGKENAEVERAIGSMNIELEKLKSNNLRLRRELTEANHSLQGAYSDIADLNAQQTQSIKHVNALKEVISVSKTVIGLREQQLEELKVKLSEIERSLADREASMLSSDLRAEYERQLQNIRTLRGLYEERSRLAEVTRQGLLRELEEQKGYNQIEINKSEALKQKVENLESELTDLKETIDNKNSDISALHEETRGLQAEMSAVNKLFSQILPGYKNKQDLDKLAHRLEENHGILTHMAEKENDSEASSVLPKLLLELVSQVDEAEAKIENFEKQGTEESKTLSNPTETTPTTNDNSTEVCPATQSITTAEEIVENLPKVWRVLLELLSHQNVAETSTAEKVTTCYKSVETKSGPVLVPSVSQTYIRLKDLIIEKLSLIKEVHRMKQLNSHLESRLGEQEKRLCLVTTELSKTWHVVGRLRRHHHQLHTHEKILKYELQQKRKLLNELKEELEYCREKWDQAREKNTQSEKDCKKLRAEFSSRKIKSIPTSCHNSAESGYSDERPSDDSSDSNDENEPLVRCKKKIAKSFETIHDSSTDFHVAEREDPVSDMLDVADLSLDTQDGDENRESSISECCNSEDILKGEKDILETEDEAGDISNEICAEGLSNIKNENHTLSKTVSKNIEQSTLPKSNETSHIVNELVNGPQLLVETKKLQSNTPSTSHSEEAKVINSVNDNFNNEKRSSEPQLVQRINYSESEAHSSKTNVSHTDSKPVVVDNIPMIDTQAILESIKRQNERLAKRDKKLENLEKVSDALLKKSHNTAKLSDSINDTLDHLLNRPNTIRQENDDQTPTNADNQKTLLVIKEESMENISGTPSSSDIRNESINTDEIVSTKPEKDTESSCSQTDDNSCNPALFDINPVSEETENQISNESNNIDTESFNSDDEVKNTNKSTQSLQTEASTSTTDIDHEARFAARDIRLKRLEEQTKSLVNKITNTNSKGMKINYKLEELHNIYGSEGSRAGTPSEGNDEAEDNTDDGDVNSEP